MAPVSQQNSPVTNSGDSEPASEPSESEVHQGRIQGTKGQAVPANIQQNTHLANLLRQPVSETNKSQRVLFLLFILVSVFITSFLLVWSSAFAVLAPLHFRIA